MKFFIFGHGSIGNRHLQNLTALGHEETKQQGGADGFLICNPTSLHVPTALSLLKYHKPIFIEKPLSHNLDNVDQLTGKILVGYCLRFDRSLREFEQKIGRLKIQSAKIVCKSWLPAWHPEKDFRQTYSAKKDLGGGVLLDLSHEIDYALWFFGPVKKVTAKLQHSPELQIETEAIADLNLEFTAGIKAAIHLSYASKQSERYCELMTADGKTFRWDYTPNNQMYIAEMKHFIDICCGKTNPLITVADGRRVLEVIEAAKHQ